MVSEETANQQFTGFGATTGGIEFEQNMTKEHMKAVFGRFDKYDSGTIATQDLGPALCALGQHLTPAELRNRISEINVDENGKIDIDDVCTLMRNLYEETEAELTEVFRVFDIDGSGSISATELKLGMHNLGEDLTDEEVEEMIREADLNGDGEVDFKEFRAVMKSIDS